MTTHKKRLQICERCQYLDKRIKVCKVCKCFMPLKARAPGAKCPKNLWEKSYDGQNNGSQRLDNG